MAGTSGLFKNLSEEEIATRITLALEPLAKTGVTIVGFSGTTIFEAGFNVQSFEKHVSVLKGLTNVRTVQNLLVTCATRKIISNAFTLGLKEVERICSYLRTEEGQNTVRSIQRLERLDKLGHGVYTAGEVAWRKLFEVQCTELSNKTKQIREEADKETAELKAKLAAVEEKKAKALRKVQKVHSVAATFAWPPAHEVGKRAWEIYVAECEKKGLAVERRTHESIIRVASEYGEEAKEEYIHRHIESERTRKKLEKWGDKYIKKLDEEGKAKVAGSFRAYMAAATGRQDVTLAAEDEEEDDEQGTGGSTNFEDVEDDLQNALGIDPEPTASTEGGEGEPAETEPPEEHGTEGGPDRSSGRKRKNKRVTRSQKTLRQ